MFCRNPSDRRAESHPKIVIVEEGPTGAAMAGIIRVDWLAIAEED
jgi:hypothetical protein